MGYRLAELAREIGGTVQGDPDRSVDAIRPLESAGPRDLSFLTHARFRAQALASGAGALLVGPGMLPALAAAPGTPETPETTGATGGGHDLLVAPDPSYALAVLLAFFHPPAAWPPGVHGTAIVGPGCVVDRTAHVGPYAVIGAGSRVGAGAVVQALAVVGRGCTLGDGAVLYPHAVLYDDTELGPGVIVHAGAVLGSDGFGYTFHQGAHRKVPQVGRVVLEADVEIGANTAIDRATLGETRVGAGTKIDNLVQVGHNVRIGKSSILCGQVGIAGSATLGDGVVLAGQAGIGDHLHLADGAQVAGQGGVLHDVPAHTQVAGYPAIPARKWRRQAILVSRLGEMNRRLRALERQLGMAESAEREGEQE